MTNVRVRIAPSPTGTLHVGTARTALYNYLYAKRHGGTFVMRLEDTDEERSKEEHTQDILDGLKWLELNWDEGPDIGGPYPPYRQMEKIDHYEKVANQLIANGTAYFCFCSQDELVKLKEDQKADGKAARYDNRCRHLSEKDLEKYEQEGRIPAIRFRVDEPRIVSWHDGIKGEIEISSSDLGGDMVIVKSTGVATYNFAVVVDDIDMKMTHVIRGEDHIHNTAKQILIYEALGATTPEFAHPALLFDEQRRKLSKRLHGEAVHIDNYRKLGYMPEAIVNYLAQVSWNPGEGKEIFTLEEACKMFDLSRVSKSPAVFDVQRLNWFNSHYLRDLPLSLITDRAMPYLPLFEGSGYTRADLEKIIACVRDGLTTLSEITEATRFFFEPKVEISDELKNTVLSQEQSAKVLKQILDASAKFPYAEPAGCKALVDTIGKDLGLKGKDLYWPIRTALSGTVKGPDLGSMIANLGEARVKARLEAALGICQSKQTV